MLYYSLTPQALQYGFLDFNNFCVDEYEFYEVSSTEHCLKAGVQPLVHELVLPVLLVLFCANDASCNCFHVLVFQMQKVENGDFNWIIPGVCHQISSCDLVYQIMGILLTSLSLMSVVVRPKCA